MATLSAFNSIDDTVREALESGLDKYAEEKGVPEYEAIPLSVLAHDDKGALIGGLTGKTFWNWLFIDLLWVGKEARKQGIGNDLVKKAEKLALARNCHSAYLWTQSFQAPAFYSKLGYQQFVMLKDFPLGHHRIGFMKQLAA